MIILINAPLTFLLQAAILVGFCFTNTYFSSVNLKIATNTVGILLTLCILFWNLTRMKAARKQAASPTVSINLNNEEPEGNKS